MKYENKVIHGDCLEVLPKFPPNSVDLILTDPPYGIKKEGVKGNLETFTKALSEMYRVLKDDSYFLTYAPIGRLPDMFEENPFNYLWQIPVYVKNGMVRSAIGFNKYQDVLLFTKGEPKQIEPFRDVIEVTTSSKRCAKRSHPTQKRVDVCQKLIDGFSKKGWLILDPFLGVGTTAIACKQLNRRFIGIEIEKKWVEISKERLRKQEEPISNFLQ